MLPKDYQDWNRAITRHFFNASHAGEIVHLTLDEETLRLIGGHNSREDAVGDFTACVRAKLRSGWCVETALMSPRDRRWIDWVPQSVGLLAFQVLVAFKMVSDNDFTAKNFWGRLAKELGQTGVKSGALPVGLSRDLHSQLWRSTVGGWANSQAYRGGRLGQLYLPPDEPYAYDRFVRLPLSQTLLRQEDRHRLKPFFQDAGLQCGECVETAYLSKLIDRNPGLTNGWLPHANRVLQDPYRREAALEQIAEELQQWDGSLDNRISTLTPVDRLRMWITISRRAPKWIMTGCGLLKKFQERYEKSNETIADLLTGSKYAPFYRNLRMLSYEEMLPGFVDVRQLIPGSQVVLIAEGPLLETLQKESEGVAESWTPLSITLPFNWKAARISTMATMQPRRIWEDLVAPRTVRIRTVGGLKLSRTSWMAGAGPWIELVGQTLPSSFWVDGQPVDYQDAPAFCDTLNSTGIHSVWVPQRRRQARVIHVREPFLADELPAPVWSLGSGWPGRADLGDSNSAITLRGNVLIGEVKPPSPPQPKTSTPPVPETALNRFSELPHLEEMKPPRTTTPMESPTRSKSPEPQVLLVKLLLGLKKNAWVLSKEEWQACDGHPHPLIRALYPSALTAWNQIQRQQF